MYNYKISTLFPTAKYKENSLQIQLSIGSFRTLDAS